MSEHSTLPFSGLHKAKFESGLAASRPATPDGLGDAYWATDTGDLSLTNTAGTAWVTFTGGAGGDLEDLADVTITTPANGQALIYNTGVWVNGIPSITLDQLSDVSTSGVANTNVLSYNGSSWVVRALNVLDDLADVVLSTPDTGDILVYNSGNLWQNLPVGADGEVLKANSAEATGLEWGVGGGGSTTLAGLTDVNLTTPAKGDLFVYDGTADWENLTVGSNGQTLVADSTEALGMKWQTTSGISALEHAWTLIPSAPFTIGVLGTTATTIFTPTAGDTTRINSIVFYSNNISEVGQTVTLYINDIVLAQQYVPQSGSWVFKPDHPLILPDSDLLKASSTDASSTTYIVNGGYDTTPVTGLVPLHMYDDETNGGAQTAYDVPIGETAYVAHVIAYCYGATGVSTGASFRIAVNDTTIDTRDIVNVCMRQGEYTVFELGLTLGSEWLLLVTGDTDMIYFWVDGAVTA